MTVPRLLHLDHDRLHQCPAPELLVLRRGETWQCAHEVLSQGASLSLPGVVGPHCLDIEVGWWLAGTCRCWHLAQLIERLWWHASLLSGDAIGGGNWWLGFSNLCVECGLVILVVDVLHTGTDAFIQAVDV
jgi:hypothetical protein